MASSQFRIVSTNYPRLRICVGLANRFSQEEYALVDTGFDGSVIAPESVLQHNLGKPDSLILCTVGDGRTIGAPVFVGSLHLLGSAHNIRMVVPVAVIGDDFILGREVIDRFEVIFDRGKSLILKK